MGADSKELENSERLGRVESEVHTLTNGFTKLEKLIGEVFTEIRQHQKETAPKPIPISLMITAPLAIITFIGALFTFNMHLISSSIAPISTQIVQLNKNDMSLKDDMNTLNSNVQLLSKDNEVVKNKSIANEDTLRWILFDENIPKKLTELQKDVEYMKGKK